MLREPCASYLILMRLNKPIGILLLLWPTLWGLWLASQGQPQGKILAIFVIGVILMRSAGCIINDFADRHLDGHVKRTRDRPLACGKVSPRAALILAALLSFSAFLLVLFCNAFTIFLAFIGLALTSLYPLMKRFTHLPQCGLGVAFAWGIPMAFAAEVNQLTAAAWFLFLTAMIWPIIYDTMYAMVDREDDQRAGIKSTAILFNSMDKHIIALLQAVFVLMLIFVGIIFQLHRIYYAALFVATLCFIYQQWLIKDRDVTRCFRAFLNNNWVGLIIFLGIYLS